jgi:hypothetical protein
MHAGSNSMSHVCTGWKEGAYDLADSLGGGNEVDDALVDAHLELVIGVST